jgi:hypothetical protein
MTRANSSSVHLTRTPSPDRVRALKTTVSEKREIKPSSQRSRGKKCALGTCTPNRVSRGSFSKLYSVTTD